MYASHTIQKKVRHTCAHFSEISYRSISWLERSEMFCVKLPLHVTRRSVAKQKSACPTCSFGDAYIYVNILQLDIESVDFKGTVLLDFTQTLSWQSSSGSLLQCCMWLAQVFLVSVCNSMAVAVWGSLRDKEQSWVLSLITTAIYYY